MLGKSVGRTAYAAACLFLLTQLLSCAHNVAQDKSSGADAKIKGAKEMVLENGEAKARGVVTYPGGDRVDWKVIEVPADQRGTFDIKLSWNPPRPGLQLAFDVFDEWNTPLVTSKKSNKKRAGRGRMKNATLDNVKGKYFIRVYAVNRGDAGAYQLTVEFKETAVASKTDWSKIEVAEPPRLAAVPEPEVPCDPLAFDPKNKACAAVCPEFGAPPGWPACKDKCPNPPDINLPQCQASMPCPNPPDRRVKSCKKTQWPKCNLAAPDPQNPNCDDAKADPVVGRILSNTVQGSELLITIGAGSNSGIAKGWTATVLRGDSGTPLSGGEVTIVRIDKQATVGKVKLTTDQIKQNDKVKLSPP